MKLYLLAVAAIAVAKVAAKPQYTGPLSDREDSLVKIEML